MHYPADLTLEAARNLYFEANGFGPDGGYAAVWVDFKLGPIPFPFPNTSGRRRAVKLHDLHHVLTGYETDFPGELEISAWEIASGCRDYLAAWQLNLGGLAAGTLLIPRRTFRAFVRGRRSRNLYGTEYGPSLLGKRVGEARRELGVDGDELRATGADGALFVLANAAGWVVGLASLAIALPLTVLAWPGLCLAARRAKSRAAIPATGVKSDAVA